MSARLRPALALLALALAPPALARAPAAAAPAPPAPAPPAREAPREAPMGDEEKAFCASELTVLENRTHLFREQGLAQAEIEKRNQGPRADLADCRTRFRVEQRRGAEEQEDLAEVDRRAGPNATELERERLWRQVRRERLATRPPGSLTPEERQELAAGLRDEVAATHKALDSTHSRNRDFMRQVHSALACYHGDRRAHLRVEISHEESLLKVGTGDSTRLYALKSDLRQSEEVLERSREAAKEFPDGLARCTEPHTAVLAHCLSIGFEGKKPEPACGAEEIQQYIRFIK